MKRLTITDIRNRIRSRLEGAEDLSLRDRYERLAETAINSTQSSQIYTVIECGCTNNDRLSLDTMCRLFDALYEYGDIPQIKKYGNAILNEYVSRVRDAKETQTYLKKKLGLAKSKVTTKIQNNFDDIKDAFDKIYSGAKSNLNRNVGQIKGAAKKVFPNNPLSKKSPTKESVYISIYEAMLDKATEMVSIDRILENYNRISKRFNIDRIIQENTIVNGVEDTIVELCELIDTYDMSIKARYNTCLETCWYGLHKNSFSFSESELVTAVTNYYMTHGKNGKACASILEVSTVFDKKDYTGDIDILMEEEPDEDDDAYIQEDEPISEWHHYDESVVDRPNNYRSYTEYSSVTPVYEVKMSTKDKVLNVLTMGNHWKKLRDEELHKHINDKFSISPTNFKKAYENWYITVAYDSNMTKDSDEVKVYRAYMIAMYDFEPDIMICGIKDFIREYNIPRGECTYGDDPNVTFVMYSFPEEHGPVLKETYGGRYFTDIVDNQVRMILYKHSNTYKIKPYIDMDNIIATQRYLDSINAESYIGEVKYINDDGENVPKVCPECGADVKVYLKGEPVFVCSNKNCSKYFGTVPFSEAKLTSEQRAKLKDSDYGIPSKKKYPMPDESHVRSAIQMFNHVDAEDEAELAKNIKKKIKKYGMSVDVGKENRFSKYYTASNETATIQNAIREYATGNQGYPVVELNEATDFNKILDDFKATNSDNKEGKLKSLVYKLYSKNVDNVVDGTPNLLSYIRTFFVIGTFAVPVIGPVLGIITFIADRIIALHMDRENTAKMRAAFQKEIRATDKKIDSTKDTEKKSRLEEYRKSLMEAYDKIDEYYSDLLSEKEMDDKFENPDDDDIRMRSSGNIGDGDDFSDFDFGEDMAGFEGDDDFNFEEMDEASRYIVYTSNLASILEFQCIHKTFNQEECKAMISKYPSFIKELADVAIKFPTIIDPRTLRRSIDDFRSDAKINNVHIGVIEKYDLDNAYSDLDNAISNQKPTRARDITYESYKLGVAIEITRTLNEVYSSCVYYSPIVETSFMNTIKLASEKLKQSFQKLSDKEKTISRNIDVSVNNFAKAAEKSMTDDNREAILKGSVLPKASKIIKLAIANIGIGVLLDPVVAVIGTLGYLGVSAHMKNKQKRAILDEIEVELKMCQKYIDLAESKNDLKSLKKLYTIQRSLERQKAKIMYNLKTKGESYHTTEELLDK